MDDSFVRCTLHYHIILLFIFWYSLDQEDDEDENDEGSQVDNGDDDDDDENGSEDNLSDIEQDDDDDKDDDSNADDDDGDGDSLSARNCLSPPKKRVRFGDTTEIERPEVMVSACYRTSTSSQHLWLAGICCRWSDDV